MCEQVLYSFPPCWQTLVTKRDESSFDWEGITHPLQVSPGLKSTKDPTRGEIEKSQEIKYFILPRPISCPRSAAWVLPLLKTSAGISSLPKFQPIRSRDKVRSTLGTTNPPFIKTGSGSFLASWGPSLTTREKTGGMEEGNAGEKRRKGEDLPATLLSSINKKRSRILT